MAKIKKSFYEWCIENGKEDWLALWDYEKNGCSPKDISYGTNKKYFFKCEKGLHDGEEKRIAELTRGHASIKCTCCNSFGQLLINTYGENAVENYWDFEKNGSLNPFEISRCSNIKVWIKCQEDEKHGSYSVRCADFALNDSRCPKCKESHGEINIREYLIKSNIEFIPQKTFPNLRGTGKNHCHMIFIYLIKTCSLNFKVFNIMKL